MRELRVIGVTPDSAHIVCVDTESGQKFRLPADDKLRAAARGDLARFGQIEIEMEATMRPRDIQARIRAGASVAQVTDESGMPASRVERFAYPVLLERARAAELAQKAHPVRPDGPAVEILIDVVTAAFTARGHTLENAEWDAWKDEKGFWVAQLQWQNGRSEIAAHWRYQPDAHGGTVSPLDDPAADLIDPDFGRALRGLATILPEEPQAPAPVEPPAEPRQQPRETAALPQNQPALEEFYEQRAVAAGGTTALPAAGTSGAIPAAGGSATGATAASPKAPTAGGRADTAHTEPAARTDTGAPAESDSRVETVDRTAPEAVEVPAAATEPDAPETKNTAEEAKAGAAKTAKPARTKRGKAPMPSWEDVLLGVRSSGH
ncbi:septation protein SepH [Nocardia cyriacigeorgica]|uniref:septation protein SepH n=1 Tax=Nocardia cyriacigeorgica TaxID=135487 RepID=UPI002453DB59|nr:septation protein SepH [Nocardia cyriacigeorgica]